MHVVLWTGYARRRRTRDQLRHLPMLLEDGIHCATAAAVAASTAADAAAPALALATSVAPTVHAAAAAESRA